jgi:4-amino-4-deoxy-L-arabinose transferase-like glycosyltransferase
MTKLADELEESNQTSNTPEIANDAWKSWVLVLLVSAAIFLGCIVSPPSLMDDVDAVQAVIARNMLHSGDWVTARLDGVMYLEKPPLIYWLIALSYKVFGEHDWAARIPVALSCIGLALLTAAIGNWAFGRKAGTYAGLAVATCVGLFLFTRIQIPDVMLTFTIALAMWAMLRALDVEEKRPSLWANVLAVNLGIGLLLKSLVAVVFPVGAGVVYLLATRQLFARETWRRLHPFRGALIAVVVAAPWHILASLRNPPYFAWTLHSGPGQYHGFFWFFFINEQLLRFLNLRYPRDYNTVPRALFWAFHLLWLFPWSVYFPALLKLSYKPVNRAGRMSLLALCWTGFILVFFTFSTTQEYYSMPVYPALALLVGAAIAQGGSLVRWGTRVLGAIAALAAVATFSIVWMVRHVPTPGDISNALALHPRYYTLSLGHMLDLTLDSFAYLRMPLLVACLAFVVGALGCFLWRGKRAVVAATLMMVLFFHAARMALVVFDPFLSSRALAEAIQQGPPGNLIVTGHFYPFSSVFFYLDREALLLNGIRHNLEYGAAAPNAPKVFLTDSELPALWEQPQRWYLVTQVTALPKLQQELGAEHITVVTTSGRKAVLTNQPVPGK